MRKPNPLYSLTAAGTLTFTPTDPPRAAGRYVIQRVRAGLGNVTADLTRRTQLRRHVIPADPGTPAQLAQRSRFRDAISMWHQLQPYERQAWNDAASHHAKPGFNHFISYYVRATPMPEQHTPNATGMLGTELSKPARLVLGSARTHHPET